MGGTMGTTWATSQLHGAALLPAPQRPSDGPQAAPRRGVPRGHVQAVVCSQAQHGGLDPQCQQGEMKHTKLGTK